MPFVEKKYSLISGIVNITDSTNNDCFFNKTTLRHLYGLELITSFEIPHQIRIVIKGYHFLFKIETDFY